MSKYKEIKGFKVQTLASDTAASGLAGGTWASGGALNTARKQGGAAGIQTASLAFGGQSPPLSPNLADQTESYNGTSWSEVNELLSGRRGMAGLGLYNAAISATGWTTGQVTNVESWDGTNWTEVNEVNQGRQAAGASGTQTAGLIFGGYKTPAPNATNLVESWNGSSWTETTEINTARNGGSGFGTQTSAILAGGANAPSLVLVESWNGSSWTEVSEINTGRQDLSGGGADNTSGIVFGGKTAPGTFQAVTEAWDGSTWTELADLATARSFSFGSGIISSALAAGGDNNNPSPAVTAVTEEWNEQTDFTQINLGQVYYNSTANAYKVTQTSAADGSWASITSGNTARRVASGVGTSVSNGMVIAGYPGENEVETWNGTSWTEVAEVNSARGSAAASSNSPNSSALFFGGDARPSNPATSALNESWNGSTWTEVGDLPAGLNGNGGAGVSNTSALSYGGSTPSATGVTNEWNGSSWTAGGSMNTARYYLTGTGTTTSALALGGFTSPPSVIRTNAEAYDGSSWTNLSATNSGHSFAGASGTTTEALLFGGEGPSYPGGAMTQTEYWDGTSWTEVADLSAGNLSPAGFGSSGVSAISSFGNNPGGLLATAEQFAAGTSNKTITVS